MLIKKRNNLLFWGILAATLLISLGVFLFLTTGIASANYDVWEAGYWNNPDLRGQPTVVTTATAIDFNWEGLSPDPSINVDNFSARWVRTVYFEPGTYRFKATMDDGMRVSIDKKQIINDWREGKVRTNEADVTLGGGPHTITVEYFEKGGVAIAGFTWSRIDGSPTEPGKPMPPPSGKPMPPPSGKPMPPPSGQPMPPPSGQPMPPPTGKPMPDQPVGIVNTSFLNVRSGPSPSYESLAVLSRGTQVQLIGRNSTGSWVEIANPQGARGWANSYYIDTKYPINKLPVSHSAGSPNEARGVVNVANLNVRYGPGTYFGVFAIIHQGWTVSIIGRDHSGGWLNVRIPSGAEGWVNAKYITGQFSIMHLPVVR